MILLGLIVTSVWIMLGLRRGEITSPFAPPPPPPPPPDPPTAL